MKKAFILLVICLTFPLSAFAVGTTDIVIESGMKSMALQMPC